LGPIRVLVGEMTGHAEEGGRRNEELIAEFAFSL